MAESKLTVMFQPKVPESYAVPVFRKFEGLNKVQMYRLLTGREQGSPVRIDFTRLPISPKRFVLIRLGRIETANAEEHRNMYVSTSTAVVPDPDSDAVKFSPEHPFIYRLNKYTKLVNENLPITPNQYAESKGFTLTQDQARTLRNDAFALPSVRRQAWEESIFEGDVQLTKDYVVDIETRTGRTFKGDAMGLWLSGNKGLRLLSVGYDYNNCGLGGVSYLNGYGRLVGEVAEPQLVAEKMGITLEQLLQGKTTQ